jgi:hypothetical protein
MNPVTRFGLFCCTVVTGILSSLVASVLYSQYDNSIEFKLRSKKELKKITVDLNSVATRYEKILIPSKSETELLNKVVDLAIRNYHRALKKYLYHDTGLDNYIFLKRSLNIFFSNSGEYKKEICKTFKNLDTDYYTKLTSQVGEYVYFIEQVKKSGRNVRGNEHIYMVYMSAVQNSFIAREHAKTLSDKGRFTVSEENIEAISKYVKKEVLPIGPLMVEAEAKFITYPIKVIMRRNNILNNNSENSLLKSLKEKLLVDIKIVETEKKYANLTKKILSQKTHDSLIYSNTFTLKNLEKDDLYYTCNPVQSR